MNNRPQTRFFGLAILYIALLFTGYRDAYGGKLKKSSLKKSDPRLTGSRDMNYDHLIVAGDRIGPVRIGRHVGDAIQHLGNPDSVLRDDSQNEVYYLYKGECILFSWEDSGLEPLISSRAIHVTCSKWSTPDGLHVGSSMKEVAAHFEEYCAKNEQGNENWAGQKSYLVIATKHGIWFYGKDRNSPVSQSSVHPVMDTWGGMCKEN